MPALQPALLKRQGDRRILGATAEMVALLASVQPRLRNMPTTMCVWPHVVRARPQIQPLECAKIVLLESSLIILRTNASRLVQRARHPTQVHRVARIARPVPTANMQIMSRTRVCPLALLVRRRMRVQQQHKRRTALLVELASMPTMQHMPVFLHAQQGKLPTKVLVRQNRTVPFALQESLPIIQHTNVFLHAPLEKHPTRALRRWTKRIARPVLAESSLTTLLTHVSMLVRRVRLLTTPPRNAQEEVAALVHSVLPRPTRLPSQRSASVPPAPTPTASVLWESSVSQPLVLVPHLAKTRRSQTLHRLALRATPKRSQELHASVELVLAHVQWAATATN